MNDCATYIGTMVHRCPSGSSAYSRDRAFSLLVDIDQLSNVGARLWLFGFDHLAPITVASRDFCPGRAGTLRARINEQLCGAGLQHSLGGRIKLLFFPRVLGAFSSRIGIFFCHAPDGSLSALIYDVRDAFGQRHVRVEPVTGQQLESGCFVAQEGRYVFEVRSPAQALSIFVYQLSSLGRRLEARFIAKRTTLCDCTLLAALLRHPLPIFAGLATAVGAAFKQWWNVLVTSSFPSRSGAASLSARRLA